MSPVPRLRIAHLTTVDVSLSLLLGTELAVDVEAGHEVFGISAPGAYVAEVEARGVRHVAVPALTRSWSLSADAAAARQLYRALRRLRLDVLHTHTPKAGVLGRVLGRAARVPVIVNTVHGIWIRPEDRFAKKAAVYGAEAVAAALSDFELYQNDEDRRKLRTVVRPRRARTVGNGIDLLVFRRDPAAGARVREELGVGAGDLLVGGIGRLVAEKGIVEFSAMARALADRATFVWAGFEDPEKRDHLGSDIAGVRFLGMRRDMPALYSALDVFVLPSHREGLSRSGMEAAACGCAVVLTDIRGCREIGTHDESLLLVPPRDPKALTAAVARLLGDAALRERLGTAAAARARADFDQRRVATASLETYALVARRKGLT